MVDERQDSSLAVVTPPEPPIVQDLMPRRFRNWILSDRELTALGFLNTFGAICITFFGLAFGAVLALQITKDTAAIPDNLTVRYFALYYVSIAATAFFGILTVIVLIWTFLDVRRIKRESLQEQRRRELLAEQPAVD